MGTNYLRIHMTECNIKLSFLGPKYTPLYKKGIKETQIRSMETTSFYGICKTKFQLKCKPLIRALIFKR